MRVSDKVQRVPISREDVHRERARSPHARQNCPGSSKQLMIDAGDSVTCPACEKEFSTFDTQKNRDRVHPIVPSHLPDFAGLVRVQTAEVRRRKSTTPRPY